MTKETKVNHGKVVDEAEAAAHAKQKKEREKK